MHATPRPQFTCGGCTRRWSGRTMAHCPTCHHTFGSVNSFTRHRQWPPDSQPPDESRCKPPADLGLFWNGARRCWSELWSTTGMRITAADRKARDDAEERTPHEPSPYEFYEDDEDVHDLLNEFDTARAQNRDRDSDTWIVVGHTDGGIEYDAAMRRVNPEPPTLGPGTLGPGVIYGPEQ